MGRMNSFLLIFILTTISGLLIGTLSFLFLSALSIAGGLREQFALSIYFLPIAALLTTQVYQKFGKGAHRGNNLVIESVNGNAVVPARMTFLTFFFTVLTHLCGGSAGREGTAVQMGGSVTNQMASRFHLTEKQRKMLILSGISAGFGSVFGTPFAGIFFGLEMRHVGKISYEALLPCVLATFVADAVADGLGATHEVWLIQPMPVATPRLIAILLISACLFGVVGRWFSLAIRTVKNLSGKLFNHECLRVLVTSSLLLLLILTLDATEYLGLSTWMIASGFEGAVQFADPLMKFLLTVLTLSAGFQGGEATPLFAIGASLGGWIGQMSGIEPSLLAALGLLAVFGSAANIPLTTVVLGMELFGVQALPYYLLTVVISYYVSGHSGIYSAQIVVVPKRPLVSQSIGLRLDEILKKKHKRF